MRRTFLLALLAVFPLYSQLPFAGISEGLQVLADITGLRPKKKIDYQMMDKSRLEHWLEERIREEVKPEEIRAEELVLKKLGLVPGDFDLKRSTMDLLVEQAAAFYDHRKKKLFLVESDSGPQPLILIHELAHALADQHFDLDKFIRKGPGDDGALARDVADARSYGAQIRHVAENRSLHARSSRQLHRGCVRPVPGAGGCSPIHEGFPAVPLRRGRQVSAGCSREARRRSIFEGLQRTA
jgi:hypothetical protein